MLKNSKKEKRKKNIIDYDEICDNKNKIKKNKDNIQVEDEGIIIENFNHISKPNINNNCSFKNFLILFFFNSILSRFTYS